MVTACAPSAVRDRRRACVGSGAPWHLARGLRSGPASCLCGQGTHRWLWHLRDGHGARSALCARARLRADERDSWRGVLGARTAVRRGATVARQAADAASNAGAGAVSAVASVRSAGPRGGPNRARCLRESLCRDRAVAGQGGEAEPLSQPRVGHPFPRRRRLPGMPHLPRHL